VLATYGRECVLKIPGVCTGIATTGDHKIPRSKRLDLQYVVSNGRPACLPCNQHRGTRDLVDVGVVVDASAFFESAGPSVTESAGSPPRDSGKTGEAL
jgi:hypothetical protein